MDRADAGSQGLICVEVAHATAPRQVSLWAISLPRGSTLAAALAACGLRPAEPNARPDSQRVGVWGRAATLATVLRDGDRVELYRALIVDPKEARRLRYRKQSPKASGKRVGSR